MDFSPIVPFALYHEKFLAIYATTLRLREVPGAGRFPTSTSSSLPRRAAGWARAQENHEVSESGVLLHGNIFACAARIGTFLAEQIQTALGFVGLIAAMAAIRVLIIVVINLPAPQYDGLKNRRPARSVQAQFWGPVCQP